MTSLPEQQSMTASVLPAIPPAEYLARFINDLLLYAASGIEDESVVSRLNSRIQAKQAARIIATFCSPVGRYGTAAPPPEHHA
jgi:hypothetical protein